MDKTVVGVCLVVLVFLSISIFFVGDITGNVIVGETSNGLSALWGFLILSAFVVLIELLIALGKRAPKEVDVTELLGDDED